MDRNKIVTILKQHSYAPDSRLYFEIKPQHQKNPHAHLRFKEHHQQMVQEAFEIVDTKTITHEISRTFITPENALCIVVVRIRRAS